MTLPAIDARDNGCLTKSLLIFIFPISLGFAINGRGRSPHIFSFMKSGFYYIALKRLVSLYGATRY